MLKIMALPFKRADVDRAELIEHYERHHVPLVLSLAPAPEIYRRNYATHHDPDPDSGIPDDVTELVFADRTSYESWVAAMYAPDSGVAADEESFLDRSATVSLEVEERA